MSDHLPLDPKDALLYIKTLATTAEESTSMDVVQEHVRMILRVVDKALPRKRKA